MTRMLCTFCPPTILGNFYRIPEKSPKSSADKMYRAYESKDQTLKNQGVTNVHLSNVHFVLRDISGLLDPGLVIPHITSLSLVWK